MNVSRHLGVKWSFLKKCSELNEDGYRYKVRSDKIPEETTEDIKELFLHPQISTPLPDKKLITKNGNGVFLFVTHFLKLQIIALNFVLIIVSQFFKMIFKKFVIIDINVPLCSDTLNDQALCYKIGYIRK